MKILMLGWELPPHNSGGLGVACYQLCKSLAQRGADIDFIVPYSADHRINFMNVRAAHPQSAADVQKVGIAYDSHKYIFADGHVEWPDLTDQQAMYELAVEQMAKETYYDVIHAHDWLTFRAALRVQENTGKPLILHVHSIESDRSGGNHGNPFVREIERLAMSLADQIIAVSEHTKAAIVREYSIPADKIQVVHNSIDLADVIPLSDDNAYHYLAGMKEHGYKVVVNIGRITIQKGLPNLLRAAQLVVQHQPKTIFLIVGSGEQEYELIELAAQLGIGKNVVFTGFQRGKNWRDAFAVGDLFVMPSVSEPFGLTPLEAIGYGTPALISKQSGVSEVINNCLKVDFWDIDEMANMITSVLRHNSLRDELHTNSLREYQRLSWNNAADSLLALYRHHVSGAVA